MRTYLLLLTILLICQFTVSAQNDERILAMTSTEELHTASNTSSASYVQGDLEVIPLKESQLGSIKVSAFPNPIKRNITLLTFGIDNKQISYQLNYGGDIIFEKKIHNSKESIDIESLESHSYILNITENSKTVKSFKIIKH